MNGAARGDIKQFRRDLERAARRFRRTFGDDRFLKRLESLDHEPENRIRIGVLFDRGLYQGPYLPSWIHTNYSSDCSDSDAQDSEGPVKTIYEGFGQFSTVEPFKVGDLEILIRGGYADPFCLPLHSFERVFDLLILGTDTDDTANEIFGPILENNCSEYLVFVGKPALEPNETFLLLAKAIERLLPPTQSLLDIAVDGIENLAKDFRKVIASQGVRDDESIPHALNTNEVESALRALRVESEWRQLRQVAESLRLAYEDSHYRIEAIERLAIEEESYRKHLENAIKSAEKDARSLGSLIQTVLVNDTNKIFDYLLENVRVEDGHLKSDSNKEQEPLLVSHSKDHVRDACRVLSKDAEKCFKKAVKAAKESQVDPVLSRAASVIGEGLIAANVPMDQYEDANPKVDYHHVKCCLDAHLETAWESLKDKSYKEKSWLSIGKRFIDQLKSLPLQIATIGAVLVIPIYFFVMFVFTIDHEIKGEWNCKGATTAYEKTTTDYEKATTPENAAKALSDRADVAFPLNWNGLKCYLDIVAQEMGKGTIAKSLVALFIPLLLLVTVLTIWWILDNKNAEFRKATNDVIKKQQDTLRKFLKDLRKLWQERAKLVGKNAAQEPLVHRFTAPLWAELATLRTSEELRAVKAAVKLVKKKLPDKEKSPRAADELKKLFESSKANEIGAA